MCVADRDCNNSIILDINMDFTQGERVKLCHSTVNKSFPSVCTLLSLLLLLRRPPLMPSKRLPSPFFHHFNWSILLKYDSERGVSVYHVNQHNVFVCWRALMSVCGCVCYHALSFWMMSCFLISLPLFSSGLLNLLCCSSLLFPSLIHFLCVCFFVSVPLFSLFDI